MNDVILVVAAHPDDEALGCGGTIAKYTRLGASVHVLFLADGVSSRATARQKQGIDERLKSARRAAEILGAESVTSLELPDNQLDTLPLLEVVQRIENVVTQLKPSIILTHWGGDLNVDHQITYQAVMTACRPLPGASVKRIMSFEVLSSTEWTHQDSSFTPNYYEPLAPELINLKLKALEAYQQEMRPKPHSRSLTGVKQLAGIRGYSVGVDYAEAFRLIRWIN